jgi:hypothetical protein
VAPVTGDQLAFQGLSQLAPQLGQPIGLVGAVGHIIMPLLELDAAELLDELLDEDDDALLEAALLLFEAALLLVTPVAPPLLAIDGPLDGLPPAASPPKPLPPKPLPTESPPSSSVPLEPVAQLASGPPTPPSSPS